MTKRISLPRTVRGKRPGFFETPGVDDALSMVLILAQEVSANNPHSTALQIARRLLKGRFPIDLNTPPDMLATLDKLD